MACLFELIIFLNLLLGGLLKSFSQAPVLFVISEDNVLPPGHSRSLLHWLKAGSHWHVVIMSDRGHVPGFCNPRWRRRVGAIWAHAWKRSDKHSVTSQNEHFRKQEHFFTIRLNIKLFEIKKTRLASDCVQRWINVKMIDEEKIDMLRQILIACKHFTFF